MGHGEGSAFFLQSSKKWFTRFTRFTGRLGVGESGVNYFIKRLTRKKMVHTLHRGVGPKIAHDWIQNPTL